MIRRPPRSTRTYTLFPYTTLFRSWVLSSLPEYTPVPVIDGFWNWYRTYNTGAAFSFLSDAGGWQTWLFSALAVGISGLLAFRSEEHTSELQSLMRISYAVFCLKKKKINNNTKHKT